MSSMEQKVEVIGEFLQNRAELQRVTGFEEIQRVAGKQLYAKGYRYNTNAPVRREDVAEALRIIADQSFKDAEILLPAIVVKFWSNEPTHEFATWATNAGLMTEGELPEGGDGPARDKINELAPVERAKVFSHYAMPAENEVAEFLKSEAEKPF